MGSDNKSEPNSAGQHALGKWRRVWVHGVIALVALAVIAYLISRLVGIFAFVGNDSLAITIAVLTVFAGPPLAGIFILYGIFPLLGKKEALRGVLTWDDRLLTEVSNAKANARIVLINWPSVEVRTMGVLTSTYAAHDSDKQLAAVYVPAAPQSRHGYIRTVQLDQVEFTDWTLQQWQLYQFSFGAASPDRLQEAGDEL